VDSRHDDWGRTVMDWMVLGIFAVFCIAMLMYQRNLVSAFRIESQQQVIPQPAPQPAPQVHVNLKPLQDVMEALPNKVLQSITASSNTHKGVLGELIGYISLRAQYDRIIPLGNIVDFVCIRFPTEDDPGCVDFIDVKTGDRCRLSKDQRKLQQLINDKSINFVKLTVDTSINEDRTK